jgi:hypothetical protein
MNELIAINQELTASEIFKPEGADLILSKIKEEVSRFVPDMTTAKGRKEIASIAAKVAKSKTYLDGLGKDLVSDWKAKSKQVDNERKKIREELDLLKAQVRKPLTEWENKEKERVDRSNAFLKKLSEYRVSFSVEDSPEVISSALRAIDREIFSDDLNEFKESALQELERSTKYLSQILEKSKKNEEERLELERLRAEKEAREKNEREEKIKKEAAEQAKKEAEEKARAERERLDREAREKEESLKREKEAALQREAEAKAATERARLDAIEREKQAKLKAEQEKVRAVEEEKRRQEANRLKEEQDRVKREENLKHTKKINSEALECLCSIEGVDEALGKAIIQEIAKKNISNVTINY